MSSFLRVVFQTLERNIFTTSQNFLSYVKLKPQVHEDLFPLRFEEYTETQLNEVSLVLRENHNRQNLKFRLVQDD
jgi:hypothetical protein